MKYIKNQACIINCVSQAMHGDQIRMSGTVGGWSCLYVAYDIMSCPSHIGEREVVMNASGTHVDVVANARSRMRAGSSSRSYTQWDRRVVKVRDRQLNADVLQSTQ
jgi:hypothetical protein